MNKYQEALNMVIRFIEGEKGCAGMFFQHRGKTYESIETLQELVDKKKSRKPIVVELTRPDGKGGKEFWEHLYQCPTCEENYKKNGFIHHFNSLEKGISYCSHCGQHIDWSDEE